MTEDEKEAGEILDGKADFVFSINYEVLPKIEIADISSIKVSRPMVEISDEEVEDAGQERRRLRPHLSGRKRARPPMATASRIDYLGKVDGVAFDGGKDEDANLTLGSNQFIPGFEEQLVGVKAGDEKQIKVTFPEDYGAANLAGKDATFDIKVKEVAAADELVIDDELAKKLGIESAERLRTVIREQIESQYGTQTRQKVKRQLLDALDARLPVRIAFQAGRCRVQQYLDADHPRAGTGRTFIRRRGNDGRGGQGRLPQAGRAPRAPWSCSLRNRPESRR